jgi:hypothetical protein
LTFIGGSTVRVRIMSGRGRGAARGGNAQSAQGGRANSGRGRNNNGGRSGGRGRGRSGGRGRGKPGQGRSSSDNNDQPAPSGAPNNFSGGLRQDNNNYHGRSNGRGAVNNPVATASRRPQPPLKKNGEKGAEAHTVSESERIRFTKILLAFREGEETLFEFPSTLTNTERKFIHQLAGQVGVVSKSTGKGENRRIAVTKRKDVKKTTGDEESMPILRIGNRGIDALRKHIVKFPPTHTEELESRDTGASLVEALARQSDQDEGGDDVIAETLNQLGLGDSREAPKVHHRRRPVNLERRKARHAEFQREKQKLSSKDKFQKLLQSRSKLPAYARQEEIVSIVAANPVTIIQGETGCGKSTQCPQFILDANPTANIIVTQRTYTVGPCLFVCSLVRSCSPSRCR